METYNPKPRPDLIGATGEATRDFTIVDAVEYSGRVNIRVSEDGTGAVYWTLLEDVTLD